MTNKCIFHDGKCNLFGYELELICKGDVAKCHDTKARRIALFHQLGYTMSMTKNTIWVRKPNGKIADEIHGCGEEYLKITERWKLL